MRKLALFAAGFSAAAVMYVYLICDARVLWLAGACLVLSPACLHLGFRRCCAVTFGILIGVIWCFCYGQLWLKPARQLYGMEQTLIMEVLECPTATPYGARTAVEVELEGRTYRAVLYGEEDLLQVSPGDRIGCLVQMEPALSDEENMQYYHRAAGTILLLYAQSDLAVEPGTPRWPVRLRLWFQQRIDTLYDDDIRPLLKALLTGDQQDLSYGLRNDLSIAGLSHSIAVSGLHVSVLLMALTLVCGYNPRLTALLGIPLSIAFVLMTGASPSACRSAVMQVMMLAAPLMRRENDPWTSLSAAALLLLMENPWAITNVGFQLSFAAVAGLLVFSSPLQKRLLALRKTPGRLWRTAVSGISASLAATVATLPLTVYYFGAVSICAVFVNLLALWAMNIMLVLGLVSCMVGAVGAVFALPVTFLSRYVLRLVEVVARFPYAAAFSQNIPLMIWAVCAYGLSVAMLLRKKAVRIWLPAVMIVSLVACKLWGSWEFSHNAPVYRVLDVGQGQCILLEMGEVTAVVDCGGAYPEAAGEQAARVLNSAGKTHVDVLAITHYDSDHAGGAEQLLHRIQVELVLLPDVPDNSGIRRSIEEAARGSGARVMTVSSLTELSFSGGKITIYPPVSKDNDNNSGICVLATAEEYDMLITGDLDQEAELRLMSQYALPKVEVLAAGHHGAENSTGLTLLKTVQPELVVISAGKDNPYGHPAQATLERIKEIGAETVCTTDAGTIVIRRR